MSALHALGQLAFATVLIGWFTFVLYITICLFDDTLDWLRGKTR